MGAGNAGIDELLEQSQMLLAGEKPVSNVFQRHLAFNLIPLPVLRRHAESITVEIEKSD